VSKWRRCFSSATEEPPSGHAELDPAVFRKEVLDESASKTGALQYDEEQDAWVGTDLITGAQIIIPNK
jgi:hypothetical protein